MMATRPEISAARRAKIATTKRLRASLASLHGVTSRVVDFDNADVYLRLESQNRMILVTFTPKGNVNRLDIDDDASLSCNDTIDPEYDEAVEIIKRVFQSKDWRAWSLKRAREKWMSRTDQNE